MTQFDVVTQLYLELCEKLSRHVSVIISIAPDMIESVIPLVDSAVPAAQRAAIFCYPVNNNDTWTRDHGPIAIENGTVVELLDFTFNGWGNKFSAELDNQITRRLQALGAFGATQVSGVDLVLEGGGIESNGMGMLLANSQCVLNPNRNPDLDQRAIENKLRACFGLQKILWLNHGYLAGDDTDSHIDTLARFGPQNQIVYVACDDQHDEHFDELQKMKVELSHFRNGNGQPFNLVALPWPSPKYHEDGHRIPASYANYLVTNGAVFVPVYDDVQDQVALSTIARVYPKRRIYGIACLPLIKQHGSLHCITMQLPHGTLHGRTA